MNKNDFKNYTMGILAGFGITLIVKSTYRATKLIADHKRKMKEYDLEIQENLTNICNILTEKVEESNDQE